MACHLHARVASVIPPMPGVAPRCAPGLDGSVAGQGQDDQAGACRGRRFGRLGRDGAVQDARPGRLAAQREAVENLALCVEQARVARGQTDQAVRAALDELGQVLDLGVPAIRDAQFSRLRAAAREALGLAAAATAQTRSAVRSNTVCTSQCSRLLPGGVTAVASTASRRGAPTPARASGCRSASTSATNSPIQSALARRRLSRATSDSDATARSSAQAASRRSERPPST